MTEDVACYSIIKRLREWISANNAILFLIGHNTKGKSGENFAGKNTIIQMMDAHIAMTHDKENKCRIIEWGQKNRKGPSDEKLFYVFGETGIEFFTEEEWNSRTEKRNFRDSFIKFAINYVSNANANSEAGAKFLEEYNKAIKEINKSKDADKVSSDLLNLLNGLSDEFES
jgi:hypothetical protein